MEMKKSKLEEVKSLVQKKVQALEGLEALIDGVDRGDLNRFLGKAENLSTLFAAFESAQKAESKEYAKIKSIICLDQRKADEKRKDASKGNRTGKIRPENGFLTARKR